MWWCHFRPHLSEHWAHQAQLTRAAVEITIYLVWPCTGSFSRSTSHSNIKRLHRAVTNKTIHTLRCLFLAPSHENCFMSFCGVTVVFLKILGRVPFRICLYKGAQMPDRIGSKTFFNPIFLLLPSTWVKCKWKRVVHVTCFYSCFLARFIVWFSGTPRVLAGLTTLEGNVHMQNISLSNEHRSWQYFHSYCLSKTNFMKPNLRP